MLKFLKELNIQDKDCIIGFIIWRLIIVDMHVLQDVNSCRT